MNALTVCENKSLLFCNFVLIVEMEIRFVNCIMYGTDKAPKNAADAAIDPSVFFSFSLMKKPKRPTVCNNKMICDIYMTKHFLDLHF